MQIDPLPLEKEFNVLSVRRRLSELSREELEEFLSESLMLMARMTHQLTQLRDHIQEAEGVKPLSER
jgi:hypothetical protein